MALSVRIRFEVFKRDEFTCQYCGRRSPEVVLEVDHIQPRADGGTDDSINLLTSCWECNRGKSDRTLDCLITGEDPHDKAIELLEKRRQVEEYNRVLAEQDYYLEREVWELAAFWNEEIGEKHTGDFTIAKRSYNWLRSALKYCPKEQIKEFMRMAFARRATKDMRYVAVCVRNWRAESMAQKDMRAIRDGKGDLDY